MLTNTALQYLFESGSGFKSRWFVLRFAERLILKQSRACVRLTQLRRVSVSLTMDSSWLGLDDFFSSSRLSSRRSRISSDFGLGPRDLTFDTTTLRDSLLREFDDFPRRTGSRLKTKTGPFSSRRERREEAKQEEPKKEEVSQSASCEN